MAYNITIGNKTIEITESGYNILKAILEIEFSPPTVVSFCSLGGYSAQHVNHFTSFGVLDYEGINHTTFRLLKLNKDFELFITNNQ
ncbi:TPA: hypothetical protein ACHTI2_004875 [Escherichia coli]|uniref:hypothetical protein n=1 Tax=Escherichia coli TaxID=562 RepID=UPI0002679418|nr:hypothetical protein [Escherichia coli]EIQ72682.1 hypothetical protein ECEPECC34262_0421 [Escherichia coli EPEC C342-62]EFB7867328.1 hypothetical protein [Escherichia coli]EFC9615030.1 hypothetical protein [Escherichia coli]EFI9983920.1 hypothetical protein [Escherichia coli]ELK1043593.1 hypothetical protein [Escherichia coli]